MHALGLQVLQAAILASAPRVHPGPAGITEAGPPAPASAEASGAWLRREFGVRPDTRWDGRRIELVHGGWLLLLREHLDGRPIAGARLALRVGPDGRLRQVIGTALDAAVAVSSAGPRSAASVWWPTVAGVIPARVEDAPLTWRGGQPEALRTWVDLRTGEVLASESTIHEIVVPIRGWEENSLLTPETVDYDVTLADFEAILLEDGVFRIYQCNWDDVAQACDPAFGPVGQEPSDLLMDPPVFDDAEGNASAVDPHAALQFAQFGSRFQAKLAQWGWDPFAWDELDCTWQDTDDPADCRVQVYVNVLAQDEDGVYPFNGAFYRSKGQIFMGQGYNADTAYDGDIVIHEIGHHVTHSFGRPEPSGQVDDGARLYTDVNAINEASSDVFARLMGTNDRIYDYYSELEPGTYVGPRIRDVALPFRCPDNVVGEVHMDGRIWVSALIDGMKAIEDAGLGDRDEFAAMYLGALAGIRQLPREQPEQLPEAREILLDEVGLTFGDAARDLVEDIFDERAVGVCDYLVDVREEPSMQGEVDPDEVLDARFMVFRSHRPFEEPEVIDEQPYAPPLQHQITLGPDEGGLELRYWPNVWRPDHPVDDVELVVGALVKSGDEPVVFSKEVETGVVTNDAELRFLSEPDGDEDRLVIDGLVPGQSYTVALVSLTAIDGDLLMLEDMRWETLPAPPPESDESGDAGETSDGAGGSEAEGGCGCAAGEEPSPAWILVGLVLARRRERSGPAA